MIIPQIVKEGSSLIADSLIGMMNKITVFIHVESITLRFQEKKFVS